MPEEPLLKLLRLNIDEFYLSGMVKDPVRYSVGHRGAGHGGYGFLNTFYMRNIQSGIDVDPSLQQLFNVLIALDMAAAGMDAEAICKKLEETGLDSTIYITVDTLKYLKKGGRITPAAAALGTLLRLKPVLTIQGEKLDAFAKARTMKQARSMMITAITRDLETRFGDVTGEKTYIDVAHTDNDEMAQELAAELRELFPETEVHVDPLSLSVACHIGPGALAIAASKKLEIGSLL